MSGKPFKPYYTGIHGRLLTQGLNMIADSGEIITCLTDPDIGVGDELAAREGCRVAVWGKMTDIDCMEVVKVRTLGERTWQAFESLRGANLTDGQSPAEYVESMREEDQ